MAAAEPPIRRACNRCHAQKLSCKRFGDEPCERCIRLKAECKSSLSLRWRKQHSRQVSSSRDGPADPAAAAAPAARAQAYGRRLRTDIRSSLTYNPQEGLGLGLDHHDTPHGLATSMDDLCSTTRAGDSATDTGNSNVPTLPNPTVMLDMTGFGFGFDNTLNLYAPNEHTSPQLSHQNPPIGSISGAVTSFTPSQQCQASHSQHTPLGGPWTSPASMSPNTRPDMTFMSPVPAGEGNHGQGLQSTAFTQLGQPQEIQQDEHHQQHHRLGFHFHPGSDHLVSSREPYRQVAVRVQRPIMLRPPLTADMSAYAGALWLSSLSDINTKLWELGLRVPYQVQSDGDAAAFAHLSPATDTAESQAEGFPLDVMFALSRRLVETVGEPRSSRQEDRQAEEEGQMSAASPRNTSPPNLAGAFDASSVLLVLSTYVRLLELYHNVFRLVDVEISQSSPLETFRLCKLPDVSLGAFPVAPSPVLQMILTIGVAEGFLTQLRSEMVALGAASVTNLDAGAPGASSFASVAGVTLEEVKVKEARIREELTEIRARLEGNASR